MKNVFYSILLFAGICCAFAACSKGAYNANTDSAANGGVNPLNPLTTSDQFNWEGSSKAPMSANINGAGWVAGYASWYLDTAGDNIIVGVLGAKRMALHLNGVYAGNIYPMSFKDTLREAVWADSVGSVYNVYDSKYGNSGEVYISRNDSAAIIGLFYFKGVTATGQPLSVTNGYFKIAKY